MAISQQDRDRAVALRAQAAADERARQAKGERDALGTYAAILDRGAALLGSTERAAALREVAAGLRHVQLGIDVGDHESVGAWALDVRQRIVDATLTGGPTLKWRQQQDLLDAYALVTAISGRAAW